MLIQKIFCIEQLGFYSGDDESSSDDVDEPDFIQELAAKKSERMAELVQVQTIAKVAAERLEKVGAFFHKDKHLL